MGKISRPLLSSDFFLTVPLCHYIDSYAETAKHEDKSEIA